jgi:hypothetical protein
VVNLNRRKWLARKGAKARVNNLRHLNDETRYPQLVAFVEEALYTFTDALLDMFDVRLWELHGECRREFKNDRLAATQTINETMYVLSVLGRLYLDASPDDTPMGGEVKDDLTDDVVRLALKNAEHLTRPEDDAFVDYFSKKHRQVQNFSKRLLDVMVFQRSSSDGGLLEGLKLIDEIHAGTKRKLPTAAPTGFVPPVWESEVFGEEGLNSRTGKARPVGPSSAQLRDSGAVGAAREVALRRRVRRKQSKVSAARALPDSKVILARGAQGRHWVVGGTLVSRT